MNVSFEYVKVKPEHVSMIDEQYFRVTVNYTLMNVGSLNLNWINNIVNFN